MVRDKKNDADIQSIFLSMCLRHRLHCKSEGFFQELEGFVQIVLGSYTHKFPKRGAALLPDLPELCFCLLDLRCVMVKKHSNGNGFCKPLCTSFLLTRMLLKPSEMSTSILRA